MAIVAAGALALTACTSDSGDGGDAEEPAAEEDGGGGAEQTEDPAGGTAADGGEVSTDKPQVDITETKDGEISYSVGEVEWEAYNDTTSATNSVYNAVVQARILEGFAYFGSDGTIYPNEEFGSYEVTSEDPFTVEYTISDEAVWEDGTPITTNDFLLQWASSNPKALFGETFPEGEDDEGNPLPTGPFDPVSDTFGVYVPEGPQGEVDGKTFTVEYPTPYPDWELVVTAPLPAHVVAEQGGMEPAAMAQQILDRDATGMEEAATFWNDGWIFDGQLPDPALVPSSGPYTLNGGNWNSPESLTIVANPQWWGTPPATSSLTFRFVAPEAQVQALANGDLDVIEPQPTVDTVAQIEGLGDQFTLETGPTLTWEHLDYNFAKTSPFAEANGGLAAREAFAMCVPRQQIVDNLVVPVDPEAVVMNLREVFPFQTEDYDEVLAEAYDGRYDQVDIEGAMAKLEEAGLETPVEVRIGYSSPNERRTSEVSAIKSSCDQAGFNIVDSGDAEFFAEGGALETGDWEIALFAWAGSGQVASGQPIYSTEGGQNFGGYSNPDVDAAWETLAGSNDPEVWMEQRKVIEKLLWDTLYGIPIFAHPGVVGYNSAIENIAFNSSQTQVVWNAEQWVRAE